MTHTVLTEPSFADGLHTTTEIHLDWRDRLRVLWHGRIEARVATRTEFPIGRTQHDWTRLCIPRILPQRTVGYAEGVPDIEPASV